MPPKKKRTNGLLSTNCVAVDNRRARYEYSIEEEFEAGIVLAGTEVKSLRSGQANLADSYAEFANDGALYLVSCYIPEYTKSYKSLNHEPRRPRKLLLKLRELNRLRGKIEAKGYTLIPLNIHFNAKGLAKVKLALAKGKTNYDKRQSEKDKEWKREAGNLKRKAQEE